MMSTNTHDDGIDDHPARSNPATRLQHHRRRIRDSTTDQAANPAATDARRTSDAKAASRPTSSVPRGCAELPPSRHAGGASSASAELQIRQGYKAREVQQTRRYNHDCNYHQPTTALIALSTVPELPQRRHWNRGATTLFSEISRHDGPLTYDEYAGSPRCTADRPAG